MFKTDIELTLGVVISGGAPFVTVRFDDEIIHDGLLLTETVFNIKRHLVAGTHALSVAMTGKKDCNSVNGNDMAIVVERIALNGIESSRARWNAVYRPEYPEPWLSQQVEKPAEELKASCYLGWNGIWTLEFTAPVFTWLHNIEGLGDIYSVDYFRPAKRKYPS